MGFFNYKAVTSDGRFIEGSLEAADSRAALNKVQEMGYMPVTVAEDSAEGGLSLKIVMPWKRRGVSGQDLLVFTQELSTLIRSGLPLDRSLAIMTELTTKESFRDVISDVLDKIKGGKSLAEALSAHPKVFPKIYVNMIRAGEVGGVLDDILQRLVEYQERSEQLKGHLVSSMIYPALLSVVAVISILILLLFVVPKFTEIFESTGAPIPLPMVIMIGASDFMKSYWWLVLGVLVVAAIGIQRYLASETGKLNFDRRILRFPLLGPLMQKVEVARFSRTLGTLLKSAVPLLQAMNVVKDVIGNRAIGMTMDGIKNGIKKGEGISQPVREAKIFPSFALHLLAVGEETGKLDVMLLQIADAYDREVQTAVKRIIAFFEPAMILVMGIIIGTMVVSMLLAIFSINEVPL